MTDEKEDDPLMAELAASAMELSEKFAASGEHALALLGAKYLKDGGEAEAKGEDKGESADSAVKIFFAACEVSGAAMPPAAGTHRSDYLGETPTRSAVGISGLQAGEDVN